MFNFWFRVSSIIGGEGFTVETATWKLIVYDVDGGFLPGQMIMRKLQMRRRCVLQCYSTMLGAHGKNTAIFYKRNGAIDSPVEVHVRVSEKT